MIQKVNSIHLKQLTTETILLQPINVRHSNDKSTSDGPIYISKINWKLL